MKTRYFSRDSEEELNSSKISISRDFEKVLLLVFQHFTKRKSGIFSVLNLALLVAKGLIKEFSRLGNNRVHGICT